MPELPEVETIARTLAPAVGGRVIAGIELLYRPLAPDGRPEGARGLAGPARPRRQAPRQDAPRRVRGRPDARLPSQDDRPVPFRGAGGAARQAHPAGHAVRGRRKRAQVPRRQEIRVPALPRGRSRGVVRRAGLPGPRAARGRTRGIRGHPQGAERAGSRASSSTRRRSPASATSTPTRCSSTPGSIRRRSGLVARKEAVERLYESMKKILALAIEPNGSTLQDYRDAEGKAGDFQFFHKVYDRKGEPCVVCGTPVQMKRIGGRSSHFCPRCQRKEKPAAGCPRSSRKLKTRRRFGYSKANSSECPCSSVWIEQRIPNPFVACSSQARGTPFSPDFLAFP